MFFSGHNEMTRAGVENHKINSTRTNCKLNMRAKIPAKLKIAISLWEIFGNYFEKVASDAIR